MDEGSVTNVTNVQKSVISEMSQDVRVTCVRLGESWTGMMVEAKAADSTVTLPAVNVPLLMLKREKVNGDEEVCVSVIVEIVSTAVDVKREDRPVKVSVESIETVTSVNVS